MNMVRHVAIRMNTHTVPLTAILPQLKIELIVFRFEKTCLAIVTTLDDMIGITRKIKPFTSGHSNSFAMNNIKITLAGNQRLVKK